jgi:hypothetical protein
MTRPTAATRTPPSGMAACKAILVIHISLPIQSRCAVALAYSLPPKSVMYWVNGVAESDPGSVRKAFLHSASMPHDWAPLPLYRPLGQACNNPRSGSPGNESLAWISLKALQSISG